MPKKDSTADMAIDSDSDSEVEEPKGKDELELTLDDMTEKAAKRKIAKLKGPKGGGKSAVVYLGHVPFGFFEKQMRGFFEQFGDINNLRLARSIKTTNSKGYAFIEFKDKEVAEIVAETMHNYVMYGRVLKAEVMKPEQVHPEMFKNAGRRMKRVPRAKLEALRLNAPKSEEQVAKRVAALKRSDSKKRKKLEAAGIEYEYPGYGGGDDGAAPAPKKVKKTPSKKSKIAAVAATPKATPKSKKAAVAATPKATPKSKAVKKTPAKSAKKAVKKTPAKSAKKKKVAA